MVSLWRDELGIQFPGLYLDAGKKGPMTRSAQCNGLEGRTW